MKGSKKTIPSRDRASQAIVLWVVPLLLLGAVAAYEIAGRRDAYAATGSRVPSATLDTANGPYVIGQSPGHVEVLFFSFPG